MTIDPEKTGTGPSAEGDKAQPAASAAPDESPELENLTDPQIATSGILARRISDDESLLRVAIEAGVFEAGQGELVAADIRAARQKGAEGDAAVAFDNLTKAEIKLHEAIYKRKLWWRLFYFHQLHILAYHLLVLALFLNVGSGWMAGAAADFWKIPAAAFGLGGLGAILRGLYWLHHQVARRIYRVGFLLSHLAAPWIGGLFGLFVFLLLQAGVLAVEGTPGGVQATFSPSPVSFALAFFAGFKWEWLLARLESIGTNIGNAGGKSREPSEVTNASSSSNRKQSRVDEARRGAQK